MSRPDGRFGGVSAAMRGGSEEVRFGKYVLDHGQKVTVRGNLWFHQYEQVGGDAIDFACRFYNKDYPEAVQLMLSMGVGAVRGAICQTAVGITPKA